MSPENTPTTGNALHPESRQHTQPSIRDVTDAFNLWQFDKKPEKQGRCRVMHSELELQTQQCLRIPGFDVFEYTWIRGQFVVIIESKFGTNATALPTWLRTPRIIVRQHLPLDIKPEVLVYWTGKIESGDAIKTSIGTGTIGIFMNSKNEVYGLTAGHVVVGTQDIVLRNRARTEVVQATTTVKPSTQTKSFASEVGIFKVAEQQKDAVEATQSWMNMYQFKRDVMQPCPTNIENYNLKFRIIKSFNVARSQGMIVYKDGFRTGLTMGKLVAIRHEWGYKILRKPTWTRICQ